jgi:hypothetical protein
MEETMKIVVRGQVQSEFWKRVVARIENQLPLTPEDVDTINWQANAISQESDGFISIAGYGEYFVLDLRQYFNLYWVDTGNTARIRQIAATNEETAIAIAKGSARNIVKRIIRVEQATLALTWDDES